MNKIKKILRDIGFFALFFIPIVNVYICFKIYLVNKTHTLFNWTTHKSLLWVTNIKKVKITICNGNGYDTLYDGEFGIWFTVTENKNTDLYYLCTIPIKYIGIIDDETLRVQLWNQKPKKQKRLDEIAKKFMLGAVSYE